MSPNAGAVVSIVPHLISLTTSFLDIKVKAFNNLFPTAAILDIYSTNPAGVHFGSFRGIVMPAAVVVFAG